MELAPIGLSVYSRLSHVKKTVSSLLGNDMASESILYIFSDGPKGGDEEKVEETRHYLRGITGFKKIYIIERQVNNRVDNNRDGIHLLLNEYGKLIYLEEDIVTAPKFLRFMNKALDFYKNDPRIISITGYSPPISIPKVFSTDIYLSPRFSAWGFGIWKDRFDEVKMKIDGYDSFIKDEEAIKRFRRGGEDLLDLLESEVNGVIDALDVKIMFHQFRHNLFTVAPTVSLVNNIGIDGSGIHCGKSSKFITDMDMNCNEPEMVENILPDEEIINLLYAFRSTGIRKKAKRFLKRSGWMPFARKIYHLAKH